jgi:hypothetical protein
MKYIFALALCACVCVSCGRITDTPDGCVVDFIVASEQHDMAKAWSLLGAEAQGFYNSLGEKQRRSGKGALENEINRIKIFKSVKKQYKVAKDKGNPELVKIVIIGGPEFQVQTMSEDGGYRIKDGNSVRNLLTGITAELNEGKGY